MIEGTLINLRAQEMEDLDRNYRWVNDPEVTRHLAVRYPMSLAAEEAWMRERTGSVLGWGQRALRDRNEGRRAHRQPQLP